MSNFVGFAIFSQKINAHSKMQNIFSSTFFHTYSTIIISMVRKEIFMSINERLAEFNRSNILTAAKELFLEKGISQTTVDDIAKKSNYSKSTLYVYFKSKEDIYDHIILEYIQKLKDSIQKALSEYPGFPDGYFAVCDALADFYNSYPLYFESILGELKIFKDESETVLMHIYKIGEELNEIIEGYLKTWIAKQKIILNTTPLQATFVLWASIGGIIMAAGKKEVYIQQAMGISKTEFMRNGFDLLLKSIAAEPKT